MSYCSTGYSLLTRLGSLRRLKLTQCKLPACLSQLTWLRALQLTALEESAANWEALETGLRTLASLTHLAFEVPRCDAKPPACPRMPPTLQGLTNLRRLHWDAAVAAPQNPALPAGPWLSSLQRLALPLETAAANLRLLQSAAPQLEWLGIPRWRARARGSASASGWELRMLRSLLRSAGQLAAGSLHTLRGDFGNPLPGQKAPRCPPGGPRRPPRYGAGMSRSKMGLSARPSFQRLRKLVWMTKLWDSVAAVEVLHPSFHSSVPCSFPSHHTRCCFNRCLALLFHSYMVHAQQNGLNRM